MPMLNEACFALYEGIGSVEDIDSAIQLGLNHPMGPFALMDLIGLDTTLAILEVLHRELGDPKYRPCPLLRQYVAAGWLGRKTRARLLPLPSDAPSRGADPRRGRCAMSETQRCADACCVDARRRRSPRVTVNRPEALNALDGRRCRRAGRRVRRRSSATPACAARS